MLSTTLVMPHSKAKPLSSGLFNASRWKIRFFLKNSILMRTINIFCPDMPSLLILINSAISAILNNRR
ncbi:MAG: hypothetical protein GW770_06295 [Candidatus Altiarchaeum hamiconexum]|nr:hypothetical protein [Candidatus Altarchaeum hamiconexum]